MSRFFSDIIDSLDAEVFSGDSLTIKENRDLLNRMTDRWKRELATYEILDQKTTESNEDEKQKDPAIITIIGSRAMSNGCLVKPTVITKLPIVTDVRYIQAYIEAPKKYII